MKERGPMRRRDLLTGLMATTTASAMRTTAGRSAPTVNALQATAPTISVPTISRVRPVSAGSSYWDVSSGGSTYSNNLEVNGTSVANATVTVYHGGVSVGATTANAIGDWTYSYLSGLADTTHSITATATVNGQTSAQSSMFSFTVNASITPSSVIGVNQPNHNTFNVSGWSKYAENDPTNPNACVPQDSHLIKFTSLSGDIWPDYPTCRTELDNNAGTSGTFNDGQVFYVTYEFMLDPIGGVLNSGSTSCNCGQVHSGAGTYGVSGPFVPYLYRGDVFHFLAANTSSGWDTLYTLNPIKRNVWYNAEIQLKCDTSGSTGFVYCWLNGRQVVNSTGRHTSTSQISGTGYYWKFGVYRGENSGQTQILWYRNCQMAIQ